MALHTSGPSNLPTVRQIGLRGTTKKKTVAPLLLLRGFFPECCNIPLRLGTR
jgi:hypothetical protein